MERADFLVARHIVDDSEHFNSHRSIAACRRDERKGLPFRIDSPKFPWRLCLHKMTVISFDTPSYYFTSVTHHRLPIFQTDKFKTLLCEALEEARNSSGMLYFAYVIMPDHFHIVTDGKRSPSDSLRFLNGVSARRIIDHLKENGPEASLRKLRTHEKKDEYKYSLWEHHSDKFLLTSEATLMQKVNYIHSNPVVAGVAERQQDYLHSSARFWHRCPMANEPLAINIDQIRWKNR